MLKGKTLGIQIDVKEFNVSTKTAEEAARAIGCEINQIAKSVKKADANFVKEKI